MHNRPVCRAGDGGRRFTSATSRGNRLGRRRAWTQSTPCAFVLADGGLRGVLGNGYLFTDDGCALGDGGKDQVLVARIALRFFPRGGGRAAPRAAELQTFGAERHKLLFHCGFSHNRKRWGERGADAVTVALLDRDARGPCVWVRSRVFKDQHGYRVAATTSAWPLGRERAPGELQLQLSRSYIVISFGGVGTSFRLPPGAVPQGPLHFGFITHGNDETNAVVTRVDFAGPRFTGRHTTPHAAR